MKTFSTSGTGNQQTLSEIESNKMPVYENLEAVENDLSNLEEGQLGLTKDTGNELAQPVDAVESGNLHAVTSNAVAEYAKNTIANAVIDNTKFALGAVNTNVKANYNGVLYAIFTKSTTNAVLLYEDDIEIWRSDIGGTTFVYSNVTLLIRKDHNYKWAGANVSAITSNFIPLFN